MEGRDTGSEAYERAAKYVAAQFAAAGLKPAGESGTFYQRVPMHETDLDAAASSVIVRIPMGTEVKLRFTTEVTTVPRGDFHVEAPLVFTGYGLPLADIDLKGKIAVYFNNTPAGLSEQDRESYPARRLHVLADAGVAALISIDNPAAIEPFHWPAAYARSVVLAGGTSTVAYPPALFASTPILQKLSSAPTILDEKGLSREAEEVRSSIRFRWVLVPLLTCDDQQRHLVTERACRSPWRQPSADCGVCRALGSS